MTHENILLLDFFQAYENAATVNHRDSYNEARSSLVDFAHSSLPWSEIHTGLTIVKAELTIMIELNLSGIIPYAKGLLNIVEGMLRKLELIQTIGDKDSQKSESITTDADKESMPSKDEKGQFVFTQSRLFTGPANHFGELVSLVVKAVYPKGSTLRQRQYIIKGMHFLLGWEYDGKKWQNSIDAIRKRTPDGIRMVYYLDRIVNDLNDDLSA